VYSASDLSFLKRHWIKNSNIPQRFFGYEPSDIEKTLGKFSDVIEDWLESALDGDIIKTER